jgi:hypothetical protein
VAYNAKVASAANHTALSSADSSSRSRSHVGVRDALADDPSSLSQVCVLAMPQLHKIVCRSSKTRLLICL